jgi:hypothetical protein
VRFPWREPSNVLVLNHFDPKNKKKGLLKRNVLTEGAKITAGCGWAIDSEKALPQM